MGIRIKKNSENKDLSFFLRVIKFIKNNYLGVSKAFIFELDLENPGKKTGIDLDVTFRLAIKEDIEAMDKENYNYDKNRKKYFIDRLEKGDRCILALHNDKIIGYLWIISDAMELCPSKYISLSKNRAYVYNGFVLKEFRGRKLHAAMTEYLIDILKKDGKRFVVSAIDTKNKTSLKTRSKHRYYIIGKLIHIRFFGLKYDYIKKKGLIYLQN